MRRFSTLLLAALFATGPVLAQEEGGPHVSADAYPTPAKYPFENHALVASIWRRR